MTQTGQSTLSAPEELSQAAPAAQFKAVLGEWLLIEDWQAVDIILATAAAIYLPGESVWTLVVGASGAGKSELIQCFGEVKDEARLQSQLTSHTLVSGLKDADPGLLFTLNDKLLVIKDLSPLFSMNRDDMAVIMGQVRDAYDGQLVASWGSGKATAHWKGRFGLLAGSTRSVERQWKFLADLGERFLRVDYRVDETEVVAAALDGSGQEQPMRESLGRAASLFMQECKGLAAERGQQEMPAEVKACVQDLAIIAARMRTPVPRDNTHHLVYMPQPEVGTRLGKQLLRLIEASALAHRRVPADEDYDLAVRVANDSIPSRRRVLVCAVAQGNSSAGQIARATGLATPTVSEELEDLRLLSVVERQGVAFTKETARLLDASGLLDVLTRNVPPMGIS